MFKDLLTELRRIANAVQHLPRIALALEEENRLSQQRLSLVAETVALHHKILDEQNAKRESWRRAVEQANQRTQEAAEKHHAD